MRTTIFSLYCALVHRGMDCEGMNEIMTDCSDVKNLEDNNFFVMNEQKSVGDGWRMYSSLFRSTLSAGRVAGM